jgi:hypothetical protein
MMQMDKKIGLAFLFSPFLLQFDPENFEPGQPLVHYIEKSGAAFHYQRNYKKKMLYSYSTSNLGPVHKNLAMAQNCFF